MLQLKYVQNKTKRRSIVYDLKTFKVSSFVIPANVCLFFCYLGSSTSDSLETSSTRSSPLLRRKPRDLQVQCSAHAPGNVTHCFSGLSHILSLALHFLSPCSPKRKPPSGARSFRRFFHKKKYDSRLFICF